MLKQIQKIFLKLLEKELMLVLAVLILALCTFWVRAAGDSITFNLSVFPAAGTITITYPNGGENWKVNTTETITWTTQGPVNNVKIELQREAGDSWEELIDSTIDDGSFPWPVTAPVTTTALIKISKVGDASVTDTSDAVFTISTAEDGDDGGNGHIIYNPAIDTVIPREFSNTSDVEIIITGFNFEWGAEIWLDEYSFSSTRIDSTEILFTVPADFPIGNYTLCVVNLNGGHGCYHKPIVVYLEEEEEEEPEPEEEPEIIDEEEIIPPSTGGDEEIPLFKIPILGPILDLFRPAPQEPLDYEPIPKFVPSEDVIIFTDETEKCPAILLIWLLILISLIKMLTKKFPSVWLVWLIILMISVVFVTDNCSATWLLWVLTGITFGLFIWDHFTDDVSQLKAKAKH